MHELQALAVWIGIRGTWHAYSEAILTFNCIDHVCSEMVSLLSALVHILHI